MFEKMLEQKNQPLLIVISGPSGVGKDSAIERIKERGLPFHFVVTTTSRPQRTDEVQGKDYYFVPKAEFEAMIERDEFFEYAIVYNEYKGIPKKQIREAMATGQDVVMRLDVQGAETVRDRNPEAVLIFLSTTDEKELLQRLQRRKTDTKESIRTRIENTRAEYEKIDLFDYYVVNAEGKLDETVDTLLSIILAEHHRIHPRKLSL